MQGCDPEIYTVIPISPDPWGIGSQEELAIISLSDKNASSSYAMHYKLPNRVKPIA
jgi:hypothetical protein